MRMNRLVRIATSFLGRARWACGFALVLGALAATAQAGGPPPRVDVPEIDPGTMMSALTVVSGGFLMLTGRRRRPQ